MSSLRDLLNAHASLLLLDAASARVQVGWLEKRLPARWAESAEESGVGLFECIQHLGVSPREAGAFIFCDGPGSVLGVRTAAMAVRAWSVLKPRPVFSYHSLELVAHTLNDATLSVICDARRDHWHRSSISSPLQRVPTSELKGTLATPEGFRNWTPSPENVQRVPYSLQEILPRIDHLDLFRAAGSPDAFLHEEPSYVTWTPQIHRAP